MIIESVKLSGFRNLKQKEVCFCPGKNLIHGRNGSGKTSILESIFLLTFGKSFLSRKKNELVNHDFQEFSVFLKVMNSSRSLNTSILGYFKDRFIIHVNGKSSTIFDINDYLYTVFFSSSDYNLFIENKPYTRKLFDRFIFGVNSLYISNILRYNRALKQKNFLLKKNKNSPELLSWNKIICELAEKLVGIKMKFVEALNNEINERFDHHLKIAYKPSFSLENGVSELSFLKQAGSLLPREIASGRSLIGSHLDHFDIELNERPLKEYSSGEKKVHLLMIYIAFIEMFKRLKNDYPVFLVDDFDTAMDSWNSDFITRNYPSMQVIATSVHSHENFDRFIELLSQ